MKDIYTIEGESISKYTELQEKINNDLNSQKFIKDNKITMVGRYRVDTDIMWCSFPKYMVDVVDVKNVSDDDKNKLDIIVKVIDKLRRDGRNIMDGDSIYDPSRYNNKRRKVNLFELAKFIIKDYIEYGVYEVSSYEYTNKKSGKQTWNRTLKKSIPIISNGNIVYASLWKKHNYNTNDSFISTIHKNVINASIEVCQTYGYKAVPNKIVISNSEMIYDYSSLQSVIQQEMLNCYSDRESNLLKALFAWCGETNNYKMCGCTNSFQNVWEWVNNEVFGNIPYKNSNKPTYSLSDSYNKNMDYFGTGEQIIDTLYLKKDVDKYKLFIYDAKYYVPVIDGNNIYAYPPNSDIVKQISYLNNIKRSFDKTELKIEFENIFLLPELNQSIQSKLGIEIKKDELVTHIGHVKQASFDDMVCNILSELGDVEIEMNKRDSNEDKVLLFSVKTDILYDMYLKKYKYQS